MKSSNPIFSRRGFDRPAGAGSAGDHLVNPYAGVGGSSLLKESPTVRMTMPMTMDDVIVRTAATLGTVVGPYFNKCSAEGCWWESEI
ncbi:hypothetical protein OOK36_52160 [Streptomyces sp. NBC_00365]|uniref:hypothetical protein n=1 Tax=Streptomyces sp. NBC_00365 TaxID=2975726 RepID=UPI00225B9813|nr:hypothetical protein [Streptomyces sp. NBC_00365]MCX5097098.1 hypothetical protein [Streptomyces sp. NBC_00365]